MEVEKLKVIISANTAQFKKGMDDANKQLSGLSKSGSKAGMAMKAIGAVAGAAFKVVAGAAVAATTALATLSKATEQMRKEQAKLNTAFLAAGSSAAVASKTYGELYRFLGDGGKATEAAAHLAKLTTNEKELAEWTTALQGVYATFGDSLPIESLTEAANETAKVGKVTGTMADALNWAGINEDAFNASLAACSSEQERQQLILNTLNGTYSEAARIYEENNKEILAQNEAQNSLNQTMATLGKIATPVLTAITNLANAFMSALTPAINAVTPYIVGFINLISKAVGWVSSLISSLLGTKAAGSTMSGAMATISNSTASAATGASGIGKGLGEATKQAEKLKKATAGFDELNIMSSGSSATSGGSSGSGATGGGAGGIGDIGGGVVVGGAGLTDAFDSVGDKANELGEKIKKAFGDIKKTVSEYLELFAPSVEHWGAAFETIKLSWNSVKDNFYNGAVSIGDSLLSLGGYMLEEFIPNVYNSMAENLLPILSELAGFSLEQAGKNFETFGNTINEATENIIKPALENMETIMLDALEAVGVAWAEHGDGLLDELGTTFDGLRESWDTFYKEVIEPIATAINDFVSEVWDEHLKPLWENLTDAVLAISKDLLEIWNKVLKPILDWILKETYPNIKNIIDRILAIMKTLIESVSGIINGVIKVIRGIIGFLNGVFTLNWKKAWNSIKDIVGGIWEVMWSVIKGIANLIIDGINLLWTGIYNAVRGIVNTIGDVAGVIGELLGQDWSFSIPDAPPLIPRLATGGIVTKSTIANIGENGKEAVLPLENNTGWMDILADRIAARNRTPSKIILNVDGKALGWAAIDNINDITQQTGNIQLVIV